MSSASPDPMRRARSESRKNPAQGREPDDPPDHAEGDGFATQEAQTPARCSPSSRATRAHAVGELIGPGPAVLRVPDDDRQQPSPP